MTDPQATPGSAPGAELSALLRRWWEDSARDGAKPTQSALARSVGCTQTTLSRYLNPAHPSTAPVDVVTALHRALHAEASELPRALELARATAAGDQVVLSLVDQTAPAPGPRWRRSAVRLRGPWRITAAAAALAGVLLAAWAAIELAPTSSGGRAPAAAAGTTASPAPPDWPLVLAGDQSSLARTVQRLLKAHGHNLEIDGRFSAETRTEVIAFQRRHGLEPDGKVGRRTWPLLTSVPVGPGTKSPQVAAVQNLLDRAGWPADITGQYTAATRRAIEGFQREHRLPATGTPDTATWRALTTAELAP